ncbi:hypothetical protein Tco_1301184 [Tanacetum coccineum]
MAPERSAAASKEVEELRKAGILRKTRYHTWVANRVMTKMIDRAWRMCVNFTNIYKACPKDCYSLIEIDWKVDSFSELKIKCFLDAYKGYHQIQMAKENEHKTAFHALKGVYCDRKMPFRLKIAGATYQRLVDKVFESQIGRNMEAYVDAMLNPKKCSFGMEEGKFLGHVVSKQGIKANPTKIQSLTSLKQSKTIKDVQSLNGKLAALNRKALVERENVGFDLTKSYLCPNFVEGHTAKVVGLRVADSHTGNHHEDDLTPLETI